MVMVVPIGVHMPATVVEMPWRRLMAFGFMEGSIKDIMEMCKV